MDELAKATKEYFTKYQVKDVLHPEATVLFILESPHTQEIKYGYPVAGSSGKEMTKFIYGKEYREPFGKLVSFPEDYKGEFNRLTKFGLMNVCPAPMQKKALQDYSLNEEEKKIVKILEKLRVNYKAQKHNNKEWNRVKRIILDDFAKRLKNILKENNIDYLVPCGKFASSYLELVIEGQEVTFEVEIIEGIPHPSFNQWHSYDTMENLDRVLKGILE